MINTEIYGVPSSWNNAQYMTFAKYANFNTAENPKNELQYGNTVGKTLINELVENSICTQALGTESLYSHIVYAHGDELTVDDRTFTPYFYAECNSYSKNVQNNGNAIKSNYNYNSWSPYVEGTTAYNNKSAQSRPIVEYIPKKVVYLINLTLVDDNYNTRSINMSDLRSNPDIFSTYPYVKSAALVPYCDISNTDTPQRYPINSNALFGVCPNIRMQSGVDYLDINYAAFRSMQYNGIPIYGAFGTIFAPGVGETRIYLCPKEDIGENYRVAHPWSDDFKEYLLRQAACFGAFVRISNDSGLSTTTIPLDNDDIICGILVNGVGHGDYSRGAANRDNDIWEWETNRDSDFDPYNPPDPTPYDTTTVFGNNSLYNTFIQYYACSPDGLKTLCNYIYNYINAIDTETDDITKSIVKTFYTNNPLDVIVSLKRFPFNITQYFTSGAIAPVNIRLGELITTGYGWALSGQYTVVDFGSYDCYAFFGDTFLDYSPYTYFELIIPFCGSTRIDPALFMGKTLKLKMVVDLYTGACTCYILANSLCIDSVSGNCAIDIPITGIQSADFQNSVQNAITNVKNARINTAVYNLKGNLAMGAIWTGAIGGNAFLKGGAAARVGNFISSFGTSLSNALNVGGNVASAQKAEAQNYIAESKANYDLEHVQTPFNSVGSQSAANSYIEEMQARLIIYRPKFITGWNPETYGKTVGYACMLDGQVKDFDGFTVANIDVSGINASAEEKQLIAAAFANGVYL
jgi:hypothetical protein